MYRNSIALKDTTMAIRRPGGGDSTPPPTPKDRDIASPSHFTNVEKQELVMMEVEGDAWLGVFYNQYILTGNEPRALDTTLDPTLQQYTKVLECRIAITDRVTFDADADTGTYTTTGTALTYPNTITPIVGDMWVADVSPYQKGIFTITSVRALSIYRNPVYELEYKLWGVNDEPALEDLESKVVQHLFFDIKKLRKGMAPLSTYAEANKEYNYKETMRKIVTYLYDVHFDNGQETFLFNGTSDKVYDPIACAFFNALIPRPILEGKPRVKIYTDGSHPSYLKRPTLWRALLRRTDTGLSSFPTGTLDVRPRNISTLELWYTLAAMDIPYITQLESLTLGNISLEPPYVLSNAFYDGIDITDPLEIMVRNTIIDAPITDADLISVIATWTDTSNVLPSRQRFYMSILLLCILTYKLGAL